MTSRVELRAISHRFEDLDALQAIDLSVEAGEFAVLLGPSGCGKTTLLMILAGFLRPTAGRVFIDHKDVTLIPPMNRPTTTMFQDYALFPHMSVVHNVEFGLRMKGVSRSARYKKAMALLDMVDLQDSSRKRPFELSGGQRQRVALARALAIEPDVLLLDEPLGALDLKLRRQMQDELKSIQQRVGTTFVHVTHDQEEAMAIADKIVLMNQGRIEDSGSANEVYMRPASSFAAGFMGEVNLLPGTVNSTGANSIVVDTTLGQWRLPEAAIRTGAPVSGEVKICVRPEHFRTGNNDNRVNIGQARIVDIAFFGTHQRCHLQPLADPGLNLVAHLPQSAGHKSGDLIEVTVATDFITIVAGKARLKTAQARDWYRIETRGEGISHIYEPHIKPFYRCNIWHVQGRSADMLVDSGMGVVSLKEQVPVVTRKPCIAVASHTHFDHIGCHYEFEQRLIHSSEANILANPDRQSTLAEDYVSDEIFTALPPLYSSTTYKINAAPATRIVEDGDVIDLGNRHFEVIHTPGHSPGGIALWEAATGVLFSGDTVYDGPLIEDSYHANAHDYFSSMKRLFDIPARIVHGGHFPSYDGKRHKEIIRQWLDARENL